MVLVNLVDKKKQQQRIGQTFTNIIKNIENKNLEYVWFDFHHECRNMKYENLSKLLDIIKDQLSSYDYFFVKLDHGFDLREQMNDKTVSIFLKQKGIIRTNCIDCLDRTNVVQSVFSRNLLLT